MRDAYADDDVRRAEGEFMRLDEFGVPHEILPESLDDDMRNFWRLRQKWLWGVIVSCSIYFLMVII